MMSFYNSFEEIFQEMKKRLTLTPTAMKLWNDPLKPLKLNNNHVMLYVESQFSKDMTMANFKTVMEEAFSVVTSDYTDVEWEIYTGKSPYEIRLKATGEVICYITRDKLVTFPFKLGAPSNKYEYQLVPVVNSENE